MKKLIFMLAILVIGLLLLFGGYQAISNYLVMTVPLVLHI